MSTYDLMFPGDKPKISEVVHEYNIGGNVYRVEFCWWRMHGISYQVARDGEIIAERLDRQESRDVINEAQKHAEHAERFDGQS